MNQQQLICPHCRNDRKDLMEHLYRKMFEGSTEHYYCTVCSKTFEVRGDTKQEGRDSRGNPKEGTKSNK